MASTRRFFKLPATSLLESVIALCVVSICLYIAILVYANVYTAKTSSKFYMSRNKVQTAFFMVQAGQEDSIDAGYEVKEEWLGTKLKKIRINAKSGKETPAAYYTAP